MVTMRGSCKRLEEKDDPRTGQLSARNEESMREVDVLELMLFNFYAAS